MTEAAIGYTRLSQQSDTSLERQANNIRKYASENGFSLQTIYSDGEGASGFESESREEYQRVVETVRSGTIAAVIVNDKRRLTRDVDEAMRLLPDFRENGVELHTFQDGPLDLSDPIRAAIEIVSAAAAYEEKLQEIEKAKQATAERVADPDIDHGRPRFGMTYDQDKKRQVPGEEFDTVIEILQLDSNGRSYREIKNRTGVSIATISRVIDRREWYIEREEP